MKLRKLEMKDADFMNEWMHDEDITQYMLTDFSEMDLKDCVAFISKSSNDSVNVHYAVCNDDDEYLGTVSLKNINMRDKSAEYAIIFRNKALGTGASMWATQEILRIAFEKLKLNRVYLDVLCDNKRAIRFYRKVGFIEEGIWRQHFYLRGMYHDVMWLSFLNSDWKKCCNCEVNF